LKNFLFGYNNISSLLISEWYSPVTMTKFYCWSFFPAKIDLKFMVNFGTILYSSLQGRNYIIPAGIIQKRKDPHNYSETLCKITELWQEVIKKTFIFMYISESLTLSFWTGRFKIHRLDQNDVNSMLMLSSQTRIQKFIVLWLFCWSFVFDSITKIPLDRRLYFDFFF